MSLGGAGNAAVHAVEDADEAALEAAHETQREVDEAAEQAVEHQGCVKRFNLMDPSIRPPGDCWTYLEEHEHFGSCTWHISECCICCVIVRDAREGADSACAGCLRSLPKIINVCPVWCCDFIPCGRWCPGRRCPCCMCSCAEPVWWPSPGRFARDHASFLKQSMQAGWNKPYFAYFDGNADPETGGEFEVYRDEAKGSTERMG